MAGLGELTITPHGDVITILPRNQDLKAAVAELRAMPNPSAVEKRAPLDVPHRDRRDELICVGAARIDRALLAGD